MWSSDLSSDAMWLKTLLGLGLLISGAGAVENCSPKACRDVENEKPVCGSDGLTYPNRCHFEKARCQNKNLTLSRRGACREKRPCLESVAYANAHPQYSFKPLCKPDGSYASTQCHPDTGFCWCVTPQGAPLPYTSMRWLPGVKPRCGRNSKSTRRRSSGGRNRKSRRVCKQHDKALFNNNLIKIFYGEWGREFGTASDAGAGDDAAVLGWKFKNMDRNGDGFLDKNEYKELRKLMKKMVKPKRCAKNFSRACDMNNDQMIGRQEWADCLTRDGMDDVRGQNTSNNDNEYDDEDSDGDDIFATRKSPPHGVLSGGKNNSGQTHEDESSELRDDDATDCLSDRQTALNEQHASKHYELYVPDCTPDGRYQKIQCYKSAGYCWCVHEDTGKNIPGTSVKNGTPKCDQITVTSRPMKGCPDDKKTTFLIDLLQFLHAKMTEVTNGTSIPSANGLAWRPSKEEQAATWSFVVFDKNKNKMLDRNEWKSFKEIVVGVKTLRRCGKKLPRYCDINKDRQISMTEWLDCLNIQQATTTASPSPASSRTGRNPLSLLMED